MSLPKKCFVLLFISLLLISCTDKDLKNIARTKSDAFMNDLGSEDAYLNFPEKYFSKTEMKNYFMGFGLNCDYQNRKGKFIDLFYEQMPEADKVSFIYEYFLKCDSLRFILKYDLKPDPELMGFRIEPIEQRNPMLTDPSKSLLHSK